MKNLTIKDIKILKRATKIKMLVRRENFFNIKNGEKHFNLGAYLPPYTNDAINFNKSNIMNYVNTYDISHPLFCPYVDENDNFVFANIQDLIYLNSDSKLSTTKYVGEYITYHPVSTDYKHTATTSEVLQQLPAKLLKTANAFEMVFPYSSKQVLHPKTLEPSTISINRLYYVEQKDIPNNIKNQDIKYKGETFTVKEIEEMAKGL